MRRLSAATVINLLLGASVVLTAGCRMSEATFVDKFTEADCGYLMECSSDSELTFLGWETIDDCLVDRGPIAAADASVCDLNPQAARECVKAVEEQACAGTGIDREYPAICNDAFEFCTSDTDPDTDLDTDTDTDT